MQYQNYSVYKGLQKPLEFLGFKGRYVFIALGAAIGSAILFIVLTILSQTLLAIALTLLLLGGTSIWIFVKQKKGLHSKKTHQGVYIVSHLIQMK